MIYHKKKLYDTIANIIYDRLEYEGIHGVSYDTSFSEIGIDSILFVTIIIDIEEVLKISFNDNIPLMSDCKTVNELIEKIVTQICINTNNI